jgi:hypothetical protein
MTSISLLLCTILKIGSCSERDPAHNCVVHNHTVPASVRSDPTLRQHKSLRIGLQSAFSPISLRLTEQLGHFLGLSFRISLQTIFKRTSTAQNIRREGVSSSSSEPLEEVDIF